jgi:methyltransferase
MTTSAWFVVLVGAVAVERGVELVVSTVNARRALALGGVESGQGHYPAMVALHAGLLVAAPLEVMVAGRTFLPWLGWPMLAAVIGAQVLRWWCIATLGRRWNTRVVVVPGLPLVRRGPYRRFRHPNYVAVVVEGIALPLVHTAWVTALGFTILNALVLRVRLRIENAALATVR